MNELSNAISEVGSLCTLAIVLSVALQQLFDTQLYHALFGKGTDRTGADGVVVHRPSIFFPDYELRPYFATAFGILVASVGQLSMIGQVFNVHMDSGWAGQAGQIIDWIITGIFLGGGAKTFKALLKARAETQQLVQEALRK